MLFRFLSEKYDVSDCSVLQLLYNLKFIRSSCSASLETSLIYVFTNAYLHTVQQIPNANPHTSVPALVTFLCIVVITDLTPLETNSTVIARVNRK